MQGDGSREAYGLNFRCSVSLLLFSLIFRTNHHLIPSLTKAGRYPNPPSSRAPQRPELIITHKASWTRH